MKNLQKLKGAKALRAKDLKKVLGGSHFRLRPTCNPTYDCCYPDGNGGWVYGPPCI